MPLTEKSNCRQEHARIRSEGVHMYSIATGTIKGRRDGGHENATNAQCSRAGVRYRLKLHPECFPSILDATAFSECVDHDFTTAPFLITVTVTFTFTFTLTSSIAHCSHVLVIRFYCTSIPHHCYPGHHSRYLSLATVLTTTNMTASTTTKISPKQQHAQQGKQATSHWLARYLKPVPPASQDKKEVMVGLRTQVLMQRPRTAPSTGTATMVPPMPSPLPLPHPMATERLSTRQETWQETKAPSRPPRPHSGVLRDVNAWLDTSKPSSPLMGGLSYWRDGVPGAHTGQASDVQYAIPVVHEPEDEQGSTPGSQQLKSFCRRAKRMQVRMPSLQRTRSQHARVQKKINRRSNSTPVMGIPYEETQEGSPPAFLTRLGSIRRPSTASVAPETAHHGEWVEVGWSSFVDLPLRREGTASARLEGPGDRIERHFNIVPGQTTRTGDGLRPVPATTYMPREDSMGSMSDAPTYFTGPPPPSYCSRTASILTTSSFGCIDGMNPEYRQLSQQRAQEKRSVKGKLKRLAKKCAITK